jgi:multidrug resistance efflux pump
MHGSDPNVYGCDFGEFVKKFTNSLDLAFNPADDQCSKISKSSDHPGRNGLTERLPVGPDATASGGPVMGWKGFTLAVLLVAAGGAALFFYWPFGGPADTLRLPGVVEIQEVRLGSKIGGRVCEVLVFEGDRLQAGQVLVRLETPELEAQREQLQARVQEAESALEKARNGVRQEEKDSARAALEAAQAKLKRLKAGSRAEEIRQSRSDLESATADTRLYKEDFERAERVYRSAAMPRADYDRARAVYERATGKSASIKAHLDMLLAGTRPEEIEEAEAEVRKAEANLRLQLAGTRSEDLAAAEATVAEARGKLHEVEANLREAAVVAPEPAVVEVLSVRKGDLVAANQPILRVLRTADLWVKVYVPETEISKLQLDQHVTLTVDGRPERFEGTVRQINSASEFTPRNVQTLDERRHQVFGVRIQVTDTKGVFKSGMAADVYVPLH